MDLINVDLAVGITRHLQQNSAQWVFHMLPMTAAAQCTTSHSLIRLIWINHVHSSSPHSPLILLIWNGCYKVRKRCGRYRTHVASYQQNYRIESADINTDYCPLVLVTTDLMGTLSWEIRVTYADWNCLFEHFIVISSKVEVLRCNSTITYTFAIASQNVVLSHSSTEGVLQFTGTIAISIFGPVMLDPSIVKSQDSPFPNVPIDYQD